MPHDVPRARLVPAADAVGDLNGKPGGDGIGNAVKKPGAGGHQPDRGGGIRAQRADHGGIDILHDDAGDLCEDRGEAQPPYLRDLRFECKPFLFHPAQAPICLMDSRRAVFKARHSQQCLS